MIYPLASAVLNEVAAHKGSEWKKGFMKWRYLQHGMRLWMLWETGGPLAEGRDDIVRWYLGQTQAEGDDTGRPLPKGYTRFCRGYRIWGLSPRDHSIPLSCGDEDRESLSMPDYPTQSTWREERFSRGIVTLVDAFESPIAGETLIEYIVATYGVGHLSLLAEALGQQTQVDTLIPAVFDISAAEFEADWQAYLAQRYGVE
jgi:hypothetical protein